jgi:hypothetical protein
MQHLIDSITTLTIKVDASIELLNRILNKEIVIMATLVDIQNAVAAETTVEQSVITLLGTISADLQAAIAANDPVAMQAVVDSLNTNAANLAAAVVANTPAPAPAPAPAPTPTPAP